MRSLAVFTLATILGGALWSPVPGRGAGELAQGLAGVPGTW